MRALSLELPTPNDGRTLRPATRALRATPFRDQSRRQTRVNEVSQAFHRLLAIGVCGLVDMPFRDQSRGQTRVNEVSQAFHRRPNPYRHGVECVTGSPEETEALAARLAALLRAGDVVAVSGELGAGKTTFVRGAARALGVREPVSSPTFTIGHRYDAPVPVAHLDLYRIAGIDPEEWADLEPYFDGTVAFVEWPEHGGEWLPEIRATVTLNHVDEAHRQVRIDSEDDLGL
jgi:tRNA threonylcarbamoyladenosine biosynthesis protein TsaE